MKKITLYIIIFISVFIGTLSAVVLKGYSNYEANKGTMPEIQTDDSLLTSLTNSILESEAYSGDILFSSNSNATSLNGDFSYINNGNITAQINLSGKVNSLNVDLQLTLISEQLYLSFNGVKLNCTTNDVIEVLNSVVGIINTQSGSNLSKINLSELSSSLSNIELTEIDGGYTLSLQLPGIGDIYLLTTTEYTPKQIIITNLNFGGDTYSLDIKAEEKQKSFTPINEDDYLNISSSVDYIEPILNTLTQEKLRLSGTLFYNSLNLGFNLYKNGSFIQGDITYDNIKINFEYENGYITAKLFNMYFRFTPGEAIDLVKNLIEVDLTTPLNITSIDLISLSKQFNVGIRTSNNLISSIFVENSGLRIEANVGKTLFFPNRLNEADTYLNAKDISNFIDCYSSILSNKYSLDISAYYGKIQITGRAYLELSKNFNSISQILFDGKVSGKQLKIWYHETTTFITFDNNNIKLENASISKLIESLEDLLEINISSSTNILEEIDLNDLSYKNKNLTLTIHTNEISILAYTNSYKINAKIDDLSLSVVAYPSASNYSYINNSLNESLFNDFSAAPKLITALDNTISQSCINYSGLLTIDVLDFNYSSVAVDISYNTNYKVLVITLDNLPLDSIITYYSHLYYTNQKCTLTISGGYINIYTTITTRAFNRTVCVTNKTLPLSQFSIDNLYDIMGMRQSIIKQFKKQNPTGHASDILTNLSTDCIQLLNNKLIFDYAIEFNKFVASINLTFNYKTYIDSLNAKLNIGNILFVGLSLYKY